MKARAIIQINSVSGQKNVCFTTDMEMPLENFLVPWPEYTVLSGTVLIMSLESAKLTEALMDIELHSTDGSDESIELSEVEQQKLRVMLEGVINGNPPESC